MLVRFLSAVLGLIVGATVDLLVNLLAAGIQQRAFANQFSDQALWGLAGLAVLGLLVGYWLGAPLRLKTSSPKSKSTGSLETLTMTRIRALLSYGKLRGKGIHLSDVLLIGSRIDIDTTD